MRKIILALAALFAAGPARAQAPDAFAAIAALQGPDREARLLEGARREGGLTLYSSATMEDMGVYIAAFEKKYGVKARLWRGNSEAILQRAIAEARAGRNDLDLVETGGSALEALHREAILQPWKAPVFAPVWMSPSSAASDSACRPCA